MSKNNFGYSILWKLWDTLLSQQVLTSYFSLLYFMLLGRGQGGTLRPSSHIFYECSFVLNLSKDVKIWLRTLNEEIHLNQKLLLFGINDETVSNCMIVYVKYSLWKSKIFIF